MRIKLLLSLLLFSSIVMADSNSDDPNKDARIVRIKPNCKILEEWKYPGKYSPMMAFDGNINTCIAKGMRDHLGFIVMFDRPVLIDEIRIMNGFGKSEDLFKKNSRADKFSILFYSGKELLKKEVVKLKDQREFQSLKFNKIYKTDKIIFFVWGEDAVYRGTTYNDTCITEVEFYYKGKKFEINNIDQLQKDYLKKLEATLKTAFTDRNYSEAQAGYSYIYFHKDGTVSFSDIMGCGKGELFTCTSKFVLRYWRIEELKLYMRNSKDEKWKLTKYDFFYNNVDEVKFLTIYKDPINDKNGFSMLDVIIEEKKAAERAKEREEQKKKKGK